MKRKPRMTARQLLDRWIVRGRMTQDEAADAIGISRVKLNQYLNGGRRPRELETAVLIEDATGIGVRSWLELEAPAPGNNQAPEPASQPAETDRDSNAG